MVKSLSRALMRSSSLIILLSSSVLSSHVFASEPLEVVVTADRTDVPLKNTGSAITVITSEEIEKFGSKNIADVLRTVPGLTIAESGGIGGEAKVSLRGATPGASMIMIDGIRIGDPSNTEGYFDFGNFSAANIERIEILRGPQSALYGSDAMGGVINIITKKGKRNPVREVTIEGGSYGTYGARGSISGATDRLTYAFGVNALHSDSFPRYGYRISQPIYSYSIDGSHNLLATPFPPLPKDDPVDKIGLDGRIAYKINDDVLIESGMSYFSNALQFDNPNAKDQANIYNPDNHSKADVLNGYIRSKISAFDGDLQNSITVFGNQTNRTSWQTEYFGSTTGAAPWEFGYVGKRFGAEYQGDIKSLPFGLLSFGLRRETEYIETSQDPIDAYFVAQQDSQTTNSIFTQQRFQLSDRIDLSIGGRVDAVEQGKVFPTWRSAAAYRLDEITTKLRASVGTGAKAPSLFQRFSSYGTPSLLPEKSFGFDVGFDKEFLNGAVTLSATYFKVDYQNKIDYSPDIDCYEFCYLNIGQVRSQGAEVSLDYNIIPSELKAKFSYTLINAIDQDKDQPLYRLPKHQAFFSLLYSGIQNWEFEPRLTLVGDRLDIFYYYDGVVCSDKANSYAPCDGGTLEANKSFSLNGVSKNVILPAYLKVDFLTRYKVNATNDAYIRFENLTDAHTEDVYNYGSAGRSVYVGWTSRW